MASPNAHPVVGSASLLCTTPFLPSLQPLPSLPLFLCVSLKAHTFVPSQVISYLTKSILSFTLLSNECATSPKLVFARIDLNLVFIHFAHSELDTTELEERETYCVTPCYPRCDPWTGIIASLGSSLGGQTRLLPDLQNLNRHSSKVYR